VRVELDLAALPGPLPRDVEVVLLRTAQEALANVRRHAHASHVRLRLAAGEGTAELEVLDDGLGIAAGTPDGIGLRGMRERVAAGGGDLHVAADPAGGTRVRVRVPAAGAPSGATTDRAGAS
jgi:signal transduction histidine kinase